MATELGLLTVDASDRARDDEVELEVDGSVVVVVVSSAPRATPVRRASASEDHLMAMGLKETIMKNSRELSTT